MRDVITNIAEEMMSTDIIPLFVPTANNLAGVEPYIDCFKLNPNRKKLVEPGNAITLKVPE